MQASLHLILLLTALVSPAALMDSLESELLGLQDQDRVEVLVQLAEFTRHQDRKASIQYTEEALPILERFAPGSEQAGFQQRLADVYYKLSLYDEAHELMETARLQYLDIGSDEDRGHNLNSLGIVRFKLGLRGPALQAFLAAYNLTVENGDSLQTARALNNLGLLSKFMGNDPQAISYFQQSLEIKRALGDSKGVAKTLNNIGSLEHTNGRLDAALAAYMEALAIKQEDGDLQSLAVTCGNLAQICIMLERYPEAMTYVQQEMALLQEVDDQSGSLYCRLNLADVTTKMGRLEEAEAFYQELIEEARESADKALLARALSSFGTMLQKQENGNLALLAFVEAYDLYGDMNDMVRQAQMGSLAGKVLFELGRFDDARKYLLHSIRQAQDGNDLDVAQASALVLSHVLQEGGHPEQALEFRIMSAAFSDSLQLQEGRAHAEEMIMAFEASQLHDKMERLSAENKLGQLELARMGQRRTSLLASIIFFSVASTLIVLQTRKARTLQRTIETQTAELEATISQIKDLRSLLPVCSHCLKIRSDEGFWLGMGDFVENHTDATWQRSICPDCDAKESS